MPVEKEIVKDMELEKYLKGPTNIYEPSEKKSKSSASFRFEGDQTTIAKLQNSLKKGEIPTLSDKQWESLRISRKASGQMFEYESGRFQEYLTSHGYKQQTLEESKSTESTTLSKPKQSSFKPKTPKLKNTSTEEATRKEFLEPASAKISEVAGNIRTALDKVKGKQKTQVPSEITSEGGAVVLKANKSSGFKEPVAGGGVVLTAKQEETQSTSEAVVLKANKSSGFKEPVAGGGVVLKARKNKPFEPD